MPKPTKKDTLKKKVLVKMPKIPKKQTQKTRYV